MACRGGRRCGALPAFFVPALPAEDGQSFGAPSARLYGDDRTASLELVFVVLCFFLGNSHADQRTGKSSRGGARSGAGQDGCQSATGNRRTNRRQKSGNHAQSPERANSGA